MSEKEDKQEKKQEKHVCPQCQKYTLKRIKSKKTSKHYWVCQGPQEACGAIFHDSDGSPEFPEQNEAAVAFISWLYEDGRDNSLTSWEKEFVEKLADKAQEQGGMLYFTKKQLKVLHGIADKFVGSPEF